MLDIKELKASLKLYKDSLGSERLKVKESARVPVQVGQIRVLFWMPEEYVLIFHIEDEGLVHAVPLTVWVSLTTCSLRIAHKGQNFCTLALCSLSKKRDIGTGKLSYCSGQTRDDRKSTKGCR
jgi:hypothetical protein